MQEIQLSSNIFDVSQLTSQESRENLYLSINQLDANRLSDGEIRQNFAGIKVALDIFIRQFVKLECEIKDIKLAQVAYESKMERLFLKGRMEVQELKQEIEQMRTTDRQLDKVVEVAKLLKNNNYAPMAIKSMMRGITEGDILKEAAVPDDLEERVHWAQSQGFRWNKNNRVPTKVSKQIELLERWEMEFHKGRALSQGDLRNKDLVKKLGRGGSAGALMAIEEILGYQLPERQRYSVYNCYQKAVRVLNDKIVKEEDLITIVVSSTDFDCLIDNIFGDIDQLTKSKIVSGLNRLPRPLVTSQVLSQIKIYFSTELFPTFINNDEITNPLTLLPKLQGNTYDSRLTNLIEESLKDH